VIPETQLGSMELLVPISPGELLDKLTILEIKAARITDAEKLAHVKHELDILNKLWVEAELDSPTVCRLKAALKEVNESLWAIEDDIRSLESQGDFGDGFIALARSVYFTNDQRATIKREINQALGSDLVEEKSYADYRQENS
jgi:hypothetical protein